MNTKNEKTIAIGITAILAISVFLALSMSGTVEASPAELHVGPLRPYTQIQPAINDANPGDTIIVHPNIEGPYNGHLYIDKSLTIVSSDGPDVTIIVGGVRICLGYDGAEPLAESVTFSGFTVVNDEFLIELREINSGSDVTISDNIITEGAVGIYSYRDTIDDESSVTIEGNVIYEYMHCGILFDSPVQGGSDVTIKGNEIIGFGYGVWGIMFENPIDESSTVTIEDNDISDNGVAGIHFAGDIKGGSEVTISNRNLIYGNVEYAGIAIENIWEGSTVTVTENLFAENDDGIHVGGVHDGSIVTIKGNAFGAFDLEGDSYGGNEEDGIYIDVVDGGSTVVIGGDTVAEGNLISENGNEGIVIGFVGEESDVIIAGNAIGAFDWEGESYEGNEEDGIHIDVVDGGSTVVIGGDTVGEDNLISENGDDGIDIGFVGEESDVIIAGNAIGAFANDFTYEGNSDHGIYIGFGSVESATIVGNLISGNTVGIYTEGTNYTLLIEENEITDNSDGGIACDVDEELDIDIIGNTMNSNDCSGDPSGTGGDIRLHGTDNEVSIIRANIVGNIMVEPEPGHCGSHVRVGWAGWFASTNKSYVTLTDNNMDGGRSGALKLNARDYLEVTATGNKFLNNEKCCNQIGYSSWGEEGAFAIVTNLKATFVGNDFSDDPEGEGSALLKLLAEDNIDATIIDNTFMNSQWGGTLRIGWVCGGVGETTENVTAEIRDNIFTDNWGGAILTKALDNLDVEIYGNDIDGTACEGERSAVEVESGGTINADIYDNDITNFGNAGIYVSAPVGSTVNIYENEITDGDKGIHLEDVDGTSIIGNTIQDNGHGIYLESSDDNQILYNDILTNHEPYSGIHLDPDCWGNVIHFNNIVGNYDYGVNNENGTETVNAENNWWGYPSGPNDDDEVINGTGDKISTDVDADPWLGQSSITPAEQIATATGTGTASFITDGGAITDLTAMDPPTGKPEYVDFTHGFFSFNIIGLAPCENEMVNVTITLPSAVPVGTRYWKYQDSIWYPIPIGDDDGDNVITITLVDGGTGDADEDCNGEIVDPGGPGSPTPTIIPTPTPTPTPPARRGGGGGGAPRDSDGDSYSDIDEMLAGTDPNDPNDYPGAPEVTPTPTPEPTATATAAPTAVPTPEPTAEPTPTPTEEPGFEAVFAIAGLLSIAYLVLRRRK